MPLIARPGSDVGSCPSNRRARRTRSSAIPRFASRRQGYPQRRVVAFTLLALIGSVPFFFAKSVYDPSERFGFDAFLGPKRAPLIVLRARNAERLQLLAQRIAKTIEKHSIVLQFDGIDRRGGLGVAHVVVAIGLQLLDLTLKFGHLAAGFAHRTAQILGGGGDNIPDRFESLGFHGPATIGWLPGLAPRTASRVA